jgi:hypothetical protein
MVDNKNRRQHGGKDPRRFGDDTVTDVEYKIKKKQSAAQVQHAMGRGNRDRFEAPEQTWEELEEIYKHSAVTIVQTGQSVNDLITLPGVQQQLERPAELRIAVDGMRKDLERFTAALLKIHAQHEGKTGVITDRDDYILSINVFEQYMEWNTNYQSLITPAMFEITLQLEQAYQSLSKLVTETQTPESEPVSETVEVAAETQTPDATEAVIEQVTPPTPTE